MFSFQLPRRFNKRENSKSILLMCELKKELLDDMLFDNLEIGDLLFRKQTGVTPDKLREKV